MLNEYDWSTSYDQQDEYLHHLAKFGSDSDEMNFEEGESVEATTSCGLSIGGWSIPGLFERMGLDRCPKCCDELGYPHGTGSPKNDDACMEVLKNSEKFMNLKANEALAGITQLGAIPIHCLHCGTKQNNKEMMYSTGPEHITFSFTCPGCQWTSTFKTSTIQHIIDNM